MPIISQSQYNELRPDEQKYYSEMMARANQNANEPYQPYTPQRIANIPPELRAAQAGVVNGMERESPLFDRAESAARNGARSFNQNYQEYMNPYQQAVIRQLADEGNRNFQETILPALEARFVKLGQHGSSKHTDLQLRAARDFQRELLNRQQQALAMGYQQASQAHNAQQGRELESASQLSNIGTSRQASRLSDIGSLESVGRNNQQREQSILDSQYQEFLRQISHPQERLSEQVANMYGMPHNGVNHAYYQTPAAPQGNIASSIGNIAGGLSAAQLMGINPTLLRRLAGR
jgi:hypothetical protein